MRIFLCFSQPELLQTKFQNTLTEGVINLRCSHQIFRWNFIILIILCHPGKHNLWSNRTLKMWKIICQYRPAKFYCTVSAKVCEYQTMIILNWCYRLSVAYNHESGDILVNYTRTFDPEIFNCILDAGETVF